MQIKLIPAANMPTVLFTVTYSEPPEILGMPAAWANQLHRLSADELELPPTLLALDKTTWIVTVLHSVTFDLVNCLITCMYVDGQMEEWDLRVLDGEDEGREWTACAQLLDKVLKDVNDSAIEVERERRKFEAPPPAPIPVPLPEPVDRQKQARHKKQRSLLMTLVASLVSPRSSSSSSHASPPPPPVPEAPPALQPLPPPSEPGITSTVLRRRARSNLVDAFRRHVLSRLSRQAKPGGYTTWIARSMLERVEAEMELMIREAGGIPHLYMDLNPCMELSWREDGHVEGDSFRLNAAFNADYLTPSPTLVDEPPPFGDEEDVENQSTSTDTDGSSVHTPTADVVTFDSSPFVPSTSSSPPRPSSSHRHSPDRPSMPHSLPRTPTPPTPTIPQPAFTASDLAAYNALSGHRRRLRALLDRIDGHYTHMAHDDEQLQSMLEIKSRRRAWGNRQYMGGAEARFVGFATPTRSSPLARFEPIHAKNFVHPSKPTAGPVEGVHGVEKARRGLVVTTGETNIMRLFPVCEEDEEYDDVPLLPGHSDMHSSFYLQDVPSARLVEDAVLRDAEDGLLTPLALQRHSVPIRPRTRSMIQAHPIAPTPPLTVTTTSSPPTPTSPLLPTSYLEPDTDNEKIEFNLLQPQTKIELFDVYSGEEDEDASERELGYKTEFTLAMDLPPPYRLGVGVHAMTRRYDKWVTGSAGVSSR